MKRKTSSFSFTDRSGKVHGKPAQPTPVGASEKNHDRVRPLVKPLENNGFKNKKNTPRIVRLNAQIKTGSMKPAR